MLTSQPLLEAACEWLTEDHWVQNEYADNGHGSSVSPVHAQRTDLLGALAKVLKINPVVFETSREDWPNSLCVAVDRLAHAIDPGNRFDDPVGIVATFNDRTTTSYEDAFLALKNATYPEGTK